MCIFCVHAILFWASGYKTFNELFDFHCQGEGSKCSAIVVHRPSMGHVIKGWVENSKIRCWLKPLHLVYLPILTAELNKSKHDCWLCMLVSFTCTKNMLCLFILSSPFILLYGFISGIYCRWSLMINYFCCQHYVFFTGH